MKLVVFDLDGTLTQTMGVDVECFVTAVTEVLEDYRDPELFLRYLEEARIP